MGESRPTVEQEHLQVGVVADPLRPHREPPSRSLDRYPARPATETILTTRVVQIAVARIHRPLLRRSYGRLLPAYKDPPGRCRSVLARAHGERDPCGGPDGEPDGDGRGRYRRRPSRRAARRMRRDASVSRSARRRRGGGSPALRSNAFLAVQRRGAVPPPARRRRSKRTPTRATMFCAGTTSAGSGGAGGGESAAMIAWWIQVAIATPPAGTRWMKSVWYHSGCPAE